MHQECNAASEDATVRGLHPNLLLYKERSRLRSVCRVDIN